jgi:hypothetical protein
MVAGKWVVLLAGFVGRVCDTPPLCAALMLAFWRGMGSAVGGVCRSCVRHSSTLCTTNAGGLAGVVQLAGFVGRVCDTPTLCAALMLTAWRGISMQLAGFVRGFVGRVCDTPPLCA